MLLLSFQKKPLYETENILQIVCGCQMMSDLVVHDGAFGTPLHMFGSALRFLCNPHALEVGIDNPETDDSYINILAIGTLDKEIFLDMFAEFRQVTMEVKSYQKNYSKKMEILLGSFIETWLKSNEREEFYESPYREFLAK